MSVKGRPSKLRHPVLSRRERVVRRCLVLAIAASALVGRVWAQLPVQCPLPEQRRILVRDPAQLPHAALPHDPQPPTVSDPRFDAPPANLSLDDAIRTSLDNSDVIRVLAGATAVASGSTIYDTAITNTTVDQARGPFDPNLSVTNTWDRREPPTAFFDPMDPTRTLIDGTRTDDYDLGLELSKTTLTGGEFAFGVDSLTSRFQPGVFPLNPENRTSLDVSFTQPLLNGSGVAANVAPIVIARINTERSYFQFKDSVQEMVRSVIEAYWNLVFARTDLWARERQVEQAQFAYDLTEARGRVGQANGGDVAQTKLALANFRASLIGAKANVLQQEAALRNIMGLPPYDPNRLVPVSPPAQDRLLVDWQRIIGLAEQFRPDLIELKLILEADAQQRLIARNQALPRVDAVSLYRWNGIEGVMPSGDHVGSPLGAGTDWTLGVNFSVPLGLRQARAQLRQQELIIARDRANLDQGLHSAVHDLALSVRNLDQYYEQYLAYSETRSAARDNLEQQMGRYRAGLTEYLNVLQAIVDWGNSVSAQAQSLSLYNTELARLERQTGTILETHGVRFLEERYGSVGPLGYAFPDPCYPRDLHPSENVDRYPAGEQPAEDSFHLEDPLEQLKSRRLPNVEELPPLPTIPPPVEGGPR